MGSKHKGSNEKGTEMPITKQQKKVFRWWGPVQNPWGSRRGWAVSPVSNTGVCWLLRAVSAKVL